MELISSHPIKKSDLGFHGNLFGGSLLKWIDSAAAGYAMQLCDTPRMVTVSIDKCNFEKPAKENQLLKIYGFPSKIKQELVLKTNITFVRIDDGGSPIPISERVKNKINKIFEEKVELV